MRSSGKSLIINALALTVSSLVLRTLGLAFQAFLSGKISPSGLGLFQLVSSVQMFAVTAATSGIRFSTTRIVSEELGMNRPEGVRAAMRRCFAYSAFFGCTSSLLLFIFSSYIGEVLVGDPRTVLSIRLLSFSLPFIAFSSVMSGYFTAVGRVAEFSSSQIFEQLIRMLSVSVFIGFIPENDFEHACACIVLGSCCAELLSFIFIFILFLYDRKRYRCAAHSPSHIGQRLLKIAFPLAVSSYIRTAFSTIQNLLIPRGLRKSGVSADEALTVYGQICGMVFPVIMFPSALLGAVSELIMPELTRAQVCGADFRIKELVGRTLYFCMLFSVGVAGILCFFSQEIAQSVYSSDAVGNYIAVFAFLVPINYMDGITDAMLKGLGQQLHSMRYNIADSFISALLVCLLLPRYAIKAYIFIVFFTDGFNFALSICRLYKVCRFKISLSDIFKAAFCIFGAVNISFCVLHAFTAVSPKFFCFMHISFSVLIYLIFLCLSGCLRRSELAALRRLFGKPQLS